MTWADMVGYCGVALIVGSYFLIQSGRWDGRTRRYALANGAGALLIMVSLAHTFNWPSFVIECFWLAISLYGLVRSRDSNQK